MRSRPDGVEPTSHALPVVNVLREDVVETPPGHKILLATAPDAETVNTSAPDGTESRKSFFRVPKIGDRNSEQKMQSMREKIREDFGPSVSACRCGSSHDHASLHSLHNHIESRSMPYIVGESRSVLLEVVWTPGMYL